MQSPPFPRYLVPPRSKYFPQHHVLKHPQLPFLPQCQRLPSYFNLLLQSLLSFTTTLCNGFCTQRIRFSFNDVDLGYICVIHSLCMLGYVCVVHSVHLFISVPSVNVNACKCSYIISISIMLQLFVWWIELGENVLCSI